LPPSAKTASFAYTDAVDIFIFFQRMVILCSEVSAMAKNGGKNRGTKAPGVNPQGFGQDATFTPDPKSKLENAAKKLNTK
jgi:small acid-soluble spore protein L (minor)